MPPLATLSPLMPSAPMAGATCAISASRIRPPFAVRAKARLAGLRGGYSTRIGAAIRHAGADLKRQLTHRRLLLIVTDGEPSDVDVPEREYLVEDARKAVQELGHHGVDVFCVGLDSGGDSYLTESSGAGVWCRSTGSLHFRRSCPCSISGSPTSPAFGRNACPRRSIRFRPEWAKRAFVDDAKYRAMYQRSVDDPDGFWARAGQAHRLDQAVHQGQEHLLRRARRLDQMVRGRHAQRLGQLPRPPSRRRAATRSRSSGRATTRTSPRRSPIASCTREVCRFANVLKSLGVKKGDRVTIYMPMIPEAAYRHARLRPHRRDPLGRLRRLLAGLRSPAASTTAGRSWSSPPTRACAAARRCRSRTTPTRRWRKSLGDEKVLVVRHTGGEVAMHAGRDVWYHELAAERRRPSARPSRDGRRGPALHPLHLGLDRQAEGRAAHHRRLSRLRRDDPPATSSTTTTATSTGAPPTSAGSPATATSSTGRSPTAPRR